MWRAVSIPCPLCPALQTGREVVIGGNGPWADGPALSAWGLQPDYLLTSPAWKTPSVSPSLCPLCQLGLACSSPPHQVRPLPPASCKPSTQGQFLLQLEAPSFCFQGEIAICATHSPLFNIKIHLQVVNKETKGFAQDVPEKPKSVLVDLFDKLPPPDLVWTDVTSSRLLLVFPRLALEVLLLFTLHQGPSLSGGVLMLLGPWIRGSGTHAYSQPAEN